MSSAILLMLLTGALWALVGVLFGAAPAEKDRLWSFFSLNGILFTVFVWLTQAPAAAPPREVLRLAALIVPSAVAEVFAFLLLKLAMERGPQGIAWSVSQSAMALAFLGSVAFLGTPASAAQWLGLALALASLVLFARVRPAGPAGAGAGGPRYWRILLASFLLIGAGQFLRLVPGHAGLSSGALTWRLPLQAPFGMLFWTAACLSTGRWRPRLVWRQALPYAIVVALGQIAFYRATDAADALRLTAVVLPVSIGTCILLFALWCRFVRGERLSRVGWGAVALDIAGIVLLSCA